MAHEGTSRSSEGKRRGGPESLFPSGSSCFPRGLGQRQHPPTRITASLWWPFPHSSDCLTLSPCQLGLNIAVLAHLKPSFSISVKHLFVKLSSHTLWGAICLLLNPGNVAEDAVVRMEKINSLSSWNLLPESNEGVGMRPLANRKLNKTWIMLVAVRVKWKLRWHDSGTWSYFRFRLCFPFISMNTLGQFLSFHPLSDIYIKLS